jgi:GGDEF domain-containing protein
MRYEGRVIPVSISFGVASMTDQEVADPESLLRIADTMLYHIKKKRKTVSA